MADPASRGTVPADVGERPLKVTVRCAERHLLYCLVQNQVLPNTFSPHHCELKNYSQNQVTLN